MIAQAIAIENEFSAAHMKFKEIVTWLSSKESQNLTHSEVESQLQKDGMELLRLLFQTYLDGRGLGNVGEEVEGEDGIIRTHKRETSRKLKSVFGLVEVRRQSYGDRGANSLHPKDAQLNLPCDIHTHTVRKIVAKESSCGSFEEVVLAIDEYTGTHVAKRQVEELVQKAAVDFEAFYETRSVPTLQAPKQTGPILVLTTDSKEVVVRKEDLRETTRKAAEEGQQKLKKRLSKGEKWNRKRMATVASVYTTEPFVRTPEQIVKELGPVRKISQEKRPKAESKLVWASIEKPKEEVIGEIFKEAQKRDASRQKQAVAVVDGDEKQMELLEKKAKEYGFEVTFILDIIYPLEYLWKGAYVFHPEASKEAEQWGSERLVSILKGKSRDVATGIRRMATNREILEDKRVAADKCADYLLKSR